MDLRHEIIDIVFNKKGETKENKNVMIASEQLSTEMQKVIQAKIEEHMNKTGQDVFIDNIKSATDMFEWAKIFIKKDEEINIQFIGTNKETSDNIMLFVKLDKGGVITNYDMDVK